MIRKECDMCGKIKELSAFYWRKETQKYRSNCKACCYLTSKKWAEKNRTKTRLSTRKYYQKNKKKCNQWVREWEKKNPEKVKIMRMRNAQKNPETKGYLRHKFCATSRNFLPLSREIWKEIVEKPCFYCNGVNNTLGIDRVENNIGYERKNAVSCCGVCNRMKADSTFKEFINRCHLISKNHPDNIM